MVLPMPIGKIVVRTEEISRVQEPQTDPGHTAQSAAGILPSPVPWWAKSGLSLLVLVLPVLCLVAIILRVAFRAESPRIRYAWVSFLSTLMIISGFLTTATAVVTIFAVPIPAIVDTSLPALDERSEYPLLPSTTDLTSSDISR